MKAIVTFAALFFLAGCGQSEEDNAQEHGIDTMPPSVVIPRDTATQNMPVDPMDTSQSNMPVVDPDSGRIKPL